MALSGALHRFGIFWNISVIFACFKMVTLTIINANKNQQKFTHLNEVSTVVFFSTIFSGVGQQQKQQKSWHTADWIMAENIAERPRILKLNGWTHRP